MELLLWRHAEAEDGVPDMGRKLTAKGEKQARRVALWLNDRLPGSARIVASPAMRTQQTARALIDLYERKFKIAPQLAPGTSVEEFLRTVDWPDARSTIVAVGHQPTLGLIASKLLSGIEQPWSIKKGALWWLSSRTEDGDSAATLVAMVHPGLL
ncbi:Phosphohistidine phosphatase SixA [Burkholderiales bacterium]|nr:Phosphohistidine phosphatase SixA [Burkholderiales bacterium]